MATVSTFLFVLTAVGWFLLLAAGVLLTALLLLLIAVLFMPIRFRARAEGLLRPDEEGDWDGNARWEAELRWGLIFLRAWVKGTHQGVQELAIAICGLRWPIRRGSKKGKPAAAATSAAKVEKKRTERKQRKQRKKRKVTLDDVRSYIHEGLRLVRRLTKALRLQLCGDITFGFEDPSVTGLTLGALALTGQPQALRVRPDWLTPGVEGWLSFRGKVYGFEVALALWSAYWRSPLSRRLRMRFKKREVEIHGRAG